jgi:hypothetical protein
MPIKPEHRSGQANSSLTDEELIEKARFHGLAQSAGEGSIRQHAYERYVVFEKTPDSSMRVCRIDDDDRSVYGGVVYVGWNWPPKNG